MYDTSIPPRRASANTHARPGRVSLFDERSHKLATLEVETFGRLGVEGSISSSTSWLLVVVGGGMWWVDGKERSGEGTPTPNRLGDCTGRHLEEGAAIQTPA